MINCTPHLNLISAYVLLLCIWDPTPTQHYYYYCRLVLLRRALECLVFHAPFASLEIEINPIRRTSAQSEREHHAATSQAREEGEHKSIP
uniref:Putative secreted protein n=1 Tax=Anopheles darlingi TaxID=43151 RepID=A0A2M4DCS1_ANODA